MKWRRALRHVAAWVVPVTLGYVAGFFGRSWIEGTLGGDVIEALATVAMVVVLAWFAIALAPAIVAGIKEIIADKATGPIRPIRRDDA